MPLPIKRLLRSVRGLSAPLMLTAARGRRRPVRWLLPALGIALAVAFAAGVAAEAQIAGDLSARSVLEATSPLDSEVRDAARRRRLGPFHHGRHWRPYSGRRLGVAALAGTPRVRAVKRGCRAGACDLGRRWIGIATGTERRVSHAQLAGTAHGDPAAGLAAGRCRGPAGPRPGGPAAGRGPRSAERRG